MIERFLTVDVNICSARCLFGQQPDLILVPDQFNERFEEYELLLDLHFVLLPVVESVEQLPKRIQSIRTETQSVYRVRRGTVDGNTNCGVDDQTTVQREP